MLSGASRVHAERAEADLTGANFAIDGGVTIA
jgi:hypothetical protein